MCYGSSPWAHNYICCTKLSVTFKGSPHGRCLAVSVIVRLHHPLEWGRSTIGSLSSSRMSEDVRAKLSAGSYRGDVEALITSNSKHILPVEPNIPVGFTALGANVQLTRLRFPQRTPIFTCTREMVQVARPATKHHEMHARRSCVVL